MESVLKLNLKKDIFEKVRDENVRELTFEATPFYFSRFTNNKNNTIEGVDNDPTLFKRFDKVLFSCSGETLEYDYLNMIIKNNEFVLIFGKPNETIDTIEETIELQEESKPIVEEVIEEIESPIEVEGVSEEVNDGVNEGEETLEIEYIEDTLDIEKILNDFYSRRHVYVVNKNNVTIGYGGVITCTGEKFVRNIVHNVKFKLDKVVLNLETLDKELLSLLDCNYVFINTNELKIVDDYIEVPIKTINVLEPLNWR